MAERKLTIRDEAQEKFEQTGREGFVEDFVESGVDDLAFMAMKPEDQELWNEIVEQYPSLLNDVELPR